MADPLWLDQLQPASFRGVEFQVDSIDVQAGDNVVLREYPFQDLPTVFRMGAAKEEIKFSAYVIGDDYTLQRDALRAVLTGSGTVAAAGLLVHPTAGTLQASVTGTFTIKEHPKEMGGMARFDLSFVRSEARRYPVSVPNTSAQASAAAATAKAAAVDDFASQFTLKGAPGWVSDRVVGRITSGLDSSWGLIKSASSGLGDFSNSVIGSYQVLRSGLDTIVSTPREFGSQLGLLFSLPTDLPLAASAGFQNAFSGLFDMGSILPQTDFTQSVNASSGQPAMLGLGKASALTIDSPARRQLAQLNGAVDQLVETLAVAAYVDTLANTDLPSYDQVVGMRQAVAAQCTRLLMRASTSAAPTSLPGSSWHDAIADLLTRSLMDLQSRAGDAAQMSTYTPQAWMPIWVVSYKLYGTTEWVDELMALNPQVRNPVLVPPGKPLRVLRHG